MKPKEILREFWAPVILAIIFAIMFFGGVYVFIRFPN